jgi:hypothetical protein
MPPKKRPPVVYFIDGSVHEIPSIAYITYEVGGMICTYSKDTYAQLRKEHPLLPVTLFHSVDEIKNYLIKNKIQVVIYPDYHIRYFRDLPGIKHIQVFHGISDKNYDFHTEVLEYDLFFIPGFEAYERYRRKGLLNKGTGFLVGCPKLDRVFQGVLKREEILEQLGLDPLRKTILYAPTWVDSGYSSSWKKFRHALLQNKPDGINLIVKLHPNLKKYRTQEVEAFKAKIGHFKDARFFDSLPDVVPLMAASDILVGDISSVTREYLVFRRPFVFLSNRPKWLWKRSKIVLWECGRVVRNPKKLWRAIQKTLKEPNRYMEKINRQYERTFYKPDGNAAKRAAEIIRGLLS